jgi:hypothetical protein
MVEFLWNGIKVNGILYKAKYSKCGDDSYNIYPKDYENFPSIDGLYISNPTDDLNKELIHVKSNNWFYKEILKACDEAEEHKKLEHKKKYNL